MGMPSCGLIYVAIAILIGWYLWFRDEGREEIEDISKEVFGKKIRFEKEPPEIKNWRDGLTEEEQKEIIQATHNPAGSEDDLTPD
jgi:hypothetical protein